VGQQAMQRSAHADAFRSLTSAIDLLQKLPDSPARIQRELVLQLAIHPAVIPVKGWGSSEEDRAYIRARELCEQLGNPPEFFATVYGLAWGVHYIRAECRAALEVAEQLLQKAEKSPDPARLRLAHDVLGETFFLMGELPLARKHHEIALSLDDPKRPFAMAGIDEKVVNLSWMSWIQWHLGYPDQALRTCNEAVERAHALAHPHSVAFAFSVAASYVRQRRGEIDAVREIAENEIAFCTEYGIATYLAAASGVQGWAMAMHGHEEGIGRLADWVASSPLKNRQPGFLCMLAEACIKFGRFEQALGALTEALVLADINENRYCEPETYRLKGELLLKQNASNVEEATTCFRKAIEISRKQSAKSWELRVTMCLARLLKNQGRRDEARSMLADIYNWFTEGFDTADLKDAKALLVQLAT
jgi:tetratricopeptide (TPR) repeat protein